METRERGTRGAATIRSARRRLSFRIVVDTVLVGEVLVPADTVRTSEIWCDASRLASRRDCRRHATTLSRSIGGDN